MSKQQTNFQRIQLRTARKLFQNGSEVYVIACKLRPDNLYMPAVKINPDYDFDKFVNAYEFYNCNNETGKYSAFYIKL